VEVDSPGVLAALRRGCEAASSGLIAFTDDDAAPRADWIGSLVEHFALDVGGVGGRDMIAAEPVADPTLTVGLVNPWGKLVGNHHLGAGAPREVDVLKGVNMAFRREALELPTRLRGAGAQVHWEVAVSLAARTRGWRLVYDPAIVVDHFVAPRLDADQRVRPAASAIADAAYNLQLTMLTIPYARRWRRVAYSLLVGDRGAPGLARTLAGAVRLEGAVLTSAGPAATGNLKAIADYCRGVRVTNEVKN
jgi:hypothetical protein